VDEGGKVPRVAAVRGADPGVRDADADAARHAGADAGPHAARRVAPVSVTSSDASVLTDSRPRNAPAARPVRCRTAGT